MTSFGWKRKVGASVSKSASASFETDTKDENDELVNEDIDWISLAPKRRVISLEDAINKSERLKHEGTVLAESERYWEAIKKWDEAIQLNPLNCKVFEMKAQALMALNELYPAVIAAQKAVEICPTWWVAQQTLGRAQLNLGEVRLALRCFSVAVHLHPSDRDLWEEDLMWAYSLLRQKEKAVEMEEQQTKKSTLTVTELPDDGDDKHDIDITVSVLSESDNQSVEMASLQVYDREKAASFKRTKKLKRVPQNYVVMRDK